MNHIGSRVEMVSYTEDTGGTTSLYFTRNFNILLGNKKLMVPRKLVVTPHFLSIGGSFTSQNAWAQFALVQKDYADEEGGTLSAVIDGQISPFEDDSRDTLLRAYDAPLNGDNAWMPTYDFDFPFPFFLPRSPTVVGAFLKDSVTYVGRMYASLYFDIIEASDAEIRRTLNTWRGLRNQ